MVYVDTKRCDGCGICVEACPQGAIRLADEVAVIDSELCRETGACLEACPQSALLLVTEPEEKETHPIPVRAAPLVKQASAPIGKPPASVGAWLGTALVYLVSDIAPQVFRHWMERRRQPSSLRPMDPRPIGRGQCGGKGKLRRRRRKGRGL
jgi:NAD-dependent dihydropyrimidine dehydrogenase PreA subunit